jgi:hypothetical protein
MPNENRAEELEAKIEELETKIEELFYGDKINVEVFLNTFQRIESLEKFLGVKYRWESVSDGDTRHKKIERRKECEPSMVDKK